MTETLAQPSAPNITSTINYAYDPLYRVTGANYTGSLTYTFAYRYDSVGNRTVQTATITSTLVTTYTYDNANHLTNVGGVGYTWDANGNLTSDGSAAYLYDSANRMISTTLGGVSTQFNYNGDGARLRQIAAGIPTTYTQDLAAPLPVVLQSKTVTTTTSYEFSNGTRPIGQFNAGGSGTWGYLLPDALGSVRQIATLNGSLTLAKTYDPYGSVVKTNGSGTSIFGFSGEQIDSSNLIYLRARYMQPRLGMFLSRDPVSGDVMQPGSMNGWNYAGSNPVAHIDPSGFDWQHPNPEEGRIIHIMIGFDFAGWGAKTGKDVDFQVRVEGASKAGTGNNGFADLVNFSDAEVYEIKHIPSADQAISEAEWYQQFLDIDSQYMIFSPWNLGTRYLSEFPYGKPIGDWPSDSDHQVWAGLYAPGAVVYWGTPKPDLHLDPKELTKWLNDLALLSGFCAAFQQLRKGGQTQPPPALAQPAVIPDIGVVPDLGAAPDIGAILDQIFNLLGPALEGL